MEIMKWLKEKFNDLRNKNNPDYWVDKVQDNQEKTIKYYNKALNIFQKNSEGNSEKIAEIHVKKGEIHLENKTHGDAITSFNKALEIYKDNPDKFRDCHYTDKFRDCHFNIGLACSNSFQYPEAVKSFDKALENCTDDGFSAKINLEIGRVYLRQKLELEDDFKKNSDFYDSFEGNKTKLEDDYKLKRTIFNKKIIESFQKILNNENNSINPQTLLEINYATAEACHENDKKALAKKYYEKSLEILDLPENSSLYDNKTRSYIAKKLLTLNQVLEAERVNESSRSRPQPPAPVLTQPQPPPPAPPPAPAQPQTHPIIVAITSFFDLCSCSQKR